MWSCIGLSCSRVCLPSLQCECLPNPLKHSVQGDPTRRGAVNQHWQEEVPLFTSTLRGGLRAESRRIVELERIFLASRPVSQQTSLASISSWLFQHVCGPTRHHLQYTPLKFLHQVRVSHAPATRFPTTTSVSSGNTLNRHTRGGFDKEQRVVLPSVKRSSRCLSYKCTHETLSKKKTTRTEHIVQPSASDVDGTGEMWGCAGCS